MLAQTALSHTRHLIWLSGWPASEEILINEVAISSSSPVSPQQGIILVTITFLQLLKMPSAEKPEGLTTRRLYWLQFHHSHLIINCSGTGPEHSQLHAGCPWAFVNKSNLKTIFFLWWWKIYVTIIRILKNWSIFCNFGERDINLTQHTYLHESVNDIFTVGLVDMFCCTSDKNIFYSSRVFLGLQVRIISIVNHYYHCLYY